MKIIYYCQWLQRKFSFEQSGLREGKAVLLFAAAFTHHLFQKALKFAPAFAVHIPQFYQGTVYEIQTEIF